MVKKALLLIVFSLFLISKSQSQDSTKANLKIAFTQDFIKTLENNDFQGHIDCMLPEYVKEMPLGLYAEAHNQLKLAGLQAKWTNGFVESVSDIYEFKEKKYAVLKFQITMTETEGEETKTEVQNDEMYAVYCDDYKGWKFLYKYKAATDYIPSKVVRWFNK